MPKLYTCNEYEHSVPMNLQGYCYCRYNREEVVASLGREINLNPPLTLGQLPDTSEELLKLDQVRLQKQDYSID